MVQIEPIMTQITIEIDRDRLQLTDAQQYCIDEAWRTLCDRNPRYFNGGMLAFNGFDSSTGVISAAVEQYKHHAVRDSIDLGIELLAVTGVLVAQDGDGRLKYLIGRRSPSTHRYGNLWEFGPCGGVDVPTHDTDSLDFNAILGDLNREAMEEAGIDLSHARSTPMALVHDEAVGSVDIVIRAELPTMPQMKSSWEYVDHAWISLVELIQRIESSPEEFIPTAIAIARMLDAPRDYD